MSNLIISGGVTLSGGFGAGFGGGSEATAGSGTARSLGLLGSITNPTFGGTPEQWSMDAYSYTVNNGLMSLSYDLKTAVNAGFINTEGSGYYEIPLPEGWSFSNSVTRATNTSTGVISTGLGDLLGSGLWYNSTTVDVYPGTNGLRVHIKYAGVENRWWSDQFGTVAMGYNGGYGLLWLNFTATIPVVSV